MRLRIQSIFHFGLAYGLRGSESEKVVRRLMVELGLQVIAKRRQRYFAGYLGFNALKVPD
ncbi:MAG TPA: hypothetical protein GXZ89_00540 [Fastidiosipila sp.]|nr:hypothetical protein [Fastidiosipila sp.]